MKYIYDIVLNFQEYYYQFFEWNKKDKLKNIRKISLYRVSDKDIYYLMNNKVKINLQFLKKEDNFLKNNHKKMILVSNTKISLGILLDERGTVLKKSSLIFEEEQEVNDICKELKTTQLQYLKNIHQPKRTKTRLETEKKEIILEYIETLQDISIIKYLYYEYFQKEESNKTKMKTMLKKAFSSTWTQKQNNVYDIINLLLHKESHQNITY